MTNLKIQVSLLKDNSPCISPFSACISSRGTKSTVFFSKMFVQRQYLSSPRKMVGQVCLQPVIKDQDFLRFGFFFCNGNSLCVQVLSGPFWVALWELELKELAQENADTLGTVMAASNKQQTIFCLCLVSPTSIHDTVRLIVSLQIQSQFLHSC